MNKGFRLIYHILIFKSLSHSIIQSDYLISLVSMKAQEAYRTQNRQNQKSPLPYNNQNTEHTE